MIQRLIDALIARAKRTPYFHLKGYMERYWLFRIWNDGVNFAGHEQAKLAGKIHIIQRSDAGTDLHNHPWPYVTIILRGGYWELTREGRRWYGPGSILWRGANHFHRLELRAQSPSSLDQKEVVYQPAVTLFITGPKQGSWGYLVDGQYVPWRNHPNHFKVPGEVS